MQTVFRYLETHEIPDSIATVEHICIVIAADMTKELCKHLRDSEAVLSVKNAALENYKKLLEIE